MRFLQFVISVWGGHCNWSPLVSENLAMPPQVRYLTLQLINRQQRISLRYQDHGFLVDDSADW